MTAHQHALALLAAIDADIAATRDEKEKLLLKRIRGSVNVYAERKKT